MGRVLLSRDVLSLLAKFEAMGNRLRMAIEDDDYSVAILAVDAMPTKGDLMRALQRASGRESIGIDSGGVLTEG